MMGDLLTDLRDALEEVADREMVFASEAIRMAIAEIERHRAQNVGGNEGRWQPIETAPKDGTGMLLACVDWPHSTHLGKAVPIKVGGWHLNEQRWQIFGASWRPTHWRPLPDAPGCVGAQNMSPKPCEHSPA